MCVHFTYQFVRVTRTRCTRIITVYTVHIMCIPRVYCVLTRFRTFSLSTHPIWVRVRVCVYISRINCIQSSSLTKLLSSRVSPLCVSQRAKSNERGIRYGDDGNRKTDDEMGGGGYFFLFFLPSTFPPRIEISFKIHPRDCQIINAFFPPPSNTGRCKHRVAPVPPRYTAVAVGVLHVNVFARTQYV